MIACAGSKEGNRTGERAIVTQGDDGHHLDGARALGALKALGKGPLGLRDPDWVVPVHVDGDLVKELGGLFVPRISDLEQSHLKSSHDTNELLRARIPLGRFVDKVDVLQLALDRLDPPQKVVANGLFDG